MPNSLFPNPHIEHSLPLVEELVRGRRMCIVSCEWITPCEEGNLRSGEYLPSFCATQNNGHKGENDGLLWNLQQREITSRIGEKETFD